MKTAALATGILGISASSLFAVTTANFVAGVPEPAYGAFIGLGLPAAGLIRRRR